MVVTIELKPEIEALVIRRAAAQGCDVPDYVERVLEREMQSAQTLDEILAPFRQEVSQSGMSEDELDGFFTEARRKVFQEKQARKKK